MSISLAGSRVLIVDDNEFNRKSLALVIRRAGISHIEFAVDGEDGLDKVASFRPDLVLLDVAMPRMDGLEMCRRLRSDAGHAELPILFQTALDSDAEQVACFEAGGSDFISKPIKPGECVARVRHQLERRKLFLDLASFRQRVEKELQHARDMQLSLLPEARRLGELAERYGLIIHSHFETSSELGGDFWTLFPLEEDRVGFLLVDFAGHGITAAINTFRLHTLIDRQPPREDPAAWLAQLNTSLKEVLPIGQFATAFYAILDRRHERMIWASAGAPQPLLWDGQGEPEFLDSTGFLLGATRRATFSTNESNVPPGGTLLLYSDALIECPRHDGTPLGESGIRTMFEDAVRTGGSEGGLEALLASFFSSVPRPLRDDLTAVWITRRR